MAVKKETTKKATKTTTTKKKEVAPKAETAQKTTKGCGAKKSTKAIKKDNILFVTCEATPFSQTGGLGEVAGSLPAAINSFSKDMNVSVIMPLVWGIKNEYRKDFEFVCHINVPVSWRNQYAGLFKYVYNGTTYYFIDNEYYFKRTGIYGHFDDAERFAYFGRAVLELLPYLDNMPQVVHCNDWHTAMVPIYFKHMYKHIDTYKDIKIAYTIHNIEYQGKFDRYILEEVLGLDDSLFGELEHHGVVNLMGTAMKYADVVTTVSPTYAKELQEPYFAAGLDDVTSVIKDKLVGIINGINTTVYNPATNESLFNNYSYSDINGKSVNKSELQSLLNLPKSDAPMFVAVTRLAEHKGADILKLALNQIIDKDFQLVVLGTGEVEYEQYFKDLEAHNSNKVRMITAFNPDMAQKLFAAGDIFLMPSRSEPCGLGQMMAMRYGTVPLVRACGGLSDTVTEGDEGNGIVFHNYNADDLRDAMLRAMAKYDDKTNWTALKHRGMLCDNSWQASGEKYMQLYRNMMK